LGWLFCAVGLIERLLKSKIPYLFILLLLLLAAHFESSSSAVEPIARKGQKLFTKFSLFYEKGHHITTNYRKGILIPINTEVEFIKSNKSRIVVRVPEYSLDLSIENVEEFSGEKIDGIFSRTFGENASDLSGFSEMERSNIKKGTVAVGMSKEAVIRAMGYPPRHKTPTLSLDQWRYWQNRLNTILVVFEKEKVTEIRD
jgi:hypothetical protein